MKTELQSLERSFIAIEQGLLLRLNSLEETISEKISEKRYGHIVENLNDMARYAISLGMLYRRYKEDLGAALSVSRRLLPLLKPGFFDCLEGIAVAGRTSRYSLPPEGYAADQLFHPMHCCLFAGDREYAVGLANLVCDLSFSESNLSALPAIFLANAIADKQSVFEQHLKQGDPFVKKGKAHANYSFLLSAAVRRDSNNFAKWYGVVNDCFRERGKAVGNEMWALEYGFSPKFNALVLDFQCISACKIAHRNGIALPTPTEYVPKDVIYAAAVS